ncbi:MAG TPA: MBL fold metallo-hydrolase [Anaerolineales bacterium]|nr:MBL fold metallo-hydrolase [Anaerolineales bacterium]
MDKIIVIDTELNGRSGSIGSFLLPYAGGGILVDAGPGSTIESLTRALAVHGLEPGQVTDVLLTHIHLDHAGAAGWLARKGARIHVHPVGAPHLLNPEKLLASARRIYGDRMDELWGEFLPVPPGQLSEVRDGEEIRIGELTFTALHTPGHAEHHIAYLFDDACFCGDVGGVRRSGPFYVRLPFVPPETDLGKWHQSLERIRSTKPARVALTHFGIFADAPAHLTYALRMLEDVEAWLDKTMPDVPDVETLISRYIPWLHEIGRAEGLSDELLTAYDQASPANMGASGLLRYWQKVRRVD